MEKITVKTLHDAQNGDSEAQDMLMRFLYTPVYHFILKRTGNTDVTNDLTQTTFLKCYQRISHYKEHSGTVYTWTFTIARNTLIDYYRKKKSSNSDDLRDVPAEDCSSDTQRQASQKIDSLYVARLLKELQEEEASVVTLRAIDQMTYIQIATIIGKSTDSVRQIYSRALKKLRQRVVMENNI